MSGTGAGGMSALMTNSMYASMGVSAASALGTAYAKSQALKSQGRYEETIANTNAMLTGVAEKQTLQAGDIVASRKNLETKARVGSELAEQGASGVSVGSGSAALVRGGTELAGNIDELTIRNNAMRAAFGYKIQGIQDQFQGRFARLTAKSEAQQSLISGGLGAISGPLQIQSDYLRWSRSGGGDDSKKIPKSFLNHDASAGAPA